MYESVGWIKICVGTVGLGRDPPIDLTQTTWFMLLYPSSFRSLQSYTYMYDVSFRLIFIYQYLQINRGKKHISKYLIDSTLDIVFLQAETLMHQKQCITGLII